MNKDATQAYSKGNAHKQTCKHSEKCWLGLRNRHGCLSACACVRAHTESLIKEAIIGDNWTEVLLLMSSRSASHPCKSFFSPCISLLHVSSHLSHTINLHPDYEPHSARSLATALPAALLQPSLLFRPHNMLVRKYRHHTRKSTRTHTQTHRQRYI